MACDAFNARTMTTREYHCPVSGSWHTNRYTCFTYNIYRSLSVMAYYMQRSPHTECIRMLYTASELSAALSFSRFKENVVN